MAKKSKAKTPEKQANSRGKVGYGNPPISEATQFKPGQSGNPKGKEPGPSMKTVLQSILDLGVKASDPLDGGKERDMSVQEKIVLNLAFRAMHFDVKAIKEVFDRIDGKAPQHIELGGGVDLKGNGITKEDLNKEFGELAKEISKHKKSV